MKQRLHAIATKVDALSLRERLMLFAGAAAVIVFLLYALFLNPLIARQGKLHAQIGQQRDNIDGIDREVGQKLQAYTLDPDAAARTRLGILTSESAQLAAGLRAMQSGLVAPERIAPLLETIMKANGRLQLMTMKTLPVSPMGGATPADSEPLLYRHGVELSVRGNYLDMINYMDALEAMPTQLFWGRADLAVEDYPNSRLTLTLYTLSLDRKWIKL